MKGKGTFAVGAILAFVMLVVTAVGAFAWHGTTEVHVDCSGWNVEVNTTWVDDEGVPHVGTITNSSNLSGSWAPGQTSVNWFVEVTWFDEEGNVIDTWPDGGTINKPSCPTATPPPTNTPTPTATDTPEPENEPPVCQLSYGPGEGTAPLTVNFDASGSHDPDGFIEHWQWTFGDGESRPGGAKESHVYDRPGVYYGNLVVSDDDGVTSFCTFEVRVTAPPTPTEIVIQDLSGGASCGGADVNNPNNAEAHIVIRVDGKEVIDGFAPANQTTFFPWPQPVVDFAEHSAEMSWWIYGDDGLADLGSFGPCETAQDLSATPSCKGVEVTNPNKSEAHIIVQVDDKAVIDSFAPANSTKFFAWPEPYDDPEVHAVMLDFWVWDHFAWVDIGNIGPCGTQPNPTPTSPPEEEIEVAAAEPVCREVDVKVEVRLNTDTQIANTWRIWVDDATGRMTDELLLTDHPLLLGSTNLFPSISDDCWVYFSSWAEGQEHADLWRVSVYGAQSGIYRLTNTPDVSELHPDATLVNKIRFDVNGQVFETNRWGANTIFLFEGGMPVVSTDGAKIAYVLDGFVHIWDGKRHFNTGYSGSPIDWESKGAGLLLISEGVLQMLGFASGELVLVGAWSDYAPDPRELSVADIGEMFDQVWWVMPETEYALTGPMPGTDLGEFSAQAADGVEEVNVQPDWWHWAPGRAEYDSTLVDAYLESLAAESTSAEAQIVTVSEPVCPDYTGPSVVECLDSVGMPSSLEARIELGLKYGITGIGTADGNTLLLQELVHGGRG